MSAQQQVEASAQPENGGQDHNLRYVAGVAFVASAGGFLFGYDLVIIAGALPFLTREFALSPALSGWATSSAILGAILGPLAGLWFADAIGRRRTMMLSAATFLASTIGCATAGTVGQFVIYRLIGGMGVGLAMISCPIYIAELSPAKLRGVLVNVNQLVGVIGINLAVLVSYWIAEYDGGWRLMFASQGVPVAFLILGLLIVPESPRWLAAKGHTTRALAVLQRINGRERAQQELAEIEQDVNASMSGVAEVLRPVLPQTAAARDHPDGVLAGEWRQHDAALCAHDSERCRCIVRLPLRALRIADLRRNLHRHADLVPVDPSLQSAGNSHSEYARHGGEPPFDVCAPRGTCAGGFRGHPNDAGSRQLHVRAGAAQLDHRFGDLSKSGARCRTCHRLRVPVWLLISDGAGVPDGDGLAAAEDRNTGCHVRGVRPDLRVLCALRLAHAAGDERTDAGRDGIVLEAGSSCAERELVFGQSGVGFDRRHRRLGKCGDGLPDLARRIDCL